MTDVGDAARSKRPAFELPGDVPASSRYDVGAPPVAGGLHESVTLDPDTDTVRFVGIPGALGAALMTTVTSFEAPLTPAPLKASTRAKYVPAASAPVWNVVTLPIC